MRFGEDWKTFKNRPTEGGGNYLRTFKEGKTVVRFLTEPDGWVGYLEHYNPNPGGFSFPCTGDRDSCPGCTSTQEAMRGKSAKVAITVLVEDKWVNVYKITKKFADRLELRYQRWETMMDREYEITRIGTDKKTDYDVESGDKGPLKGDWELPNIHEMLTENWEQTWGDEQQTSDTVIGKDKTENVVKLPAKPKEEVVYSEDQLRDMSPLPLKKLLRDEGHDLPDEVVESDDSGEIVDWLLAQQEKAPY